MQRNTAKAGVFALAALVVGVIQANAQSGAAPTWRGSYRYAFDGGVTAGGSQILVTYDLAVAPGAARGGCLLSSRGFQSDERIVCHADGDAGALTIRFHGYGDGRTVNRYGVAVYKPGQILFTLERGEGGKVVTKWDGFRPDLPKDAANPGEYFRAVR